MLEAVLEFIERRSRPAVVAVSLVAVGLTGALNYVTGRDVSLAVAYTAPVALVTWVPSYKWGVAVAAASAVISAWADALARHVSPFTDIITYWNILARGGIFFGAVVTLSALRQALAKERTFARRDSLTDVANRRAFDEMAELELQRGRRTGGALTCAYIDVDDLKSVNDRFGHHQGDALLCAVASALRSEFRVTDTVAPRRG